MRFGVLSDVHGNLPALESTLGALRRERVDAYIHLGDLLGYGPFPNECIETVASLEAVGVVGNHELIVLGRLSGDKCSRLAQESLAWTKSVLTADSLAYIDSFPQNATPTDTIIATHGSLNGPEEYVITPEQAATQLKQLEQDASSAGLLLIGHTHRPRAHELARGEFRFGSNPLPVDSGRWLLNPGSVGQSRLRRVSATCMVLDLRCKEATLLSVPYDVERTRRALRRHGLHSRSYHAPPGRLGSVRAAAHAVAKRIRP